MSYQSPQAILEEQEEARKKLLREQIKQGNVPLIIEDFKEGVGKKSMPLRYVINNTGKYTINENSSDFYCVDDEFIYSIDIAKVRNKIRDKTVEVLQDKTDGYFTIDLFKGQFSDCMQKTERLKNAANYDLKFIKHCEINDD